MVAGWINGWMNGWMDFHDSLIMETIDRKTSDSLL